MAPECGVAAVAMVENSGAIKAAPRPSPATSPMASLGSRRSQGRARMARAPRAPTTATKGGSQGNHCGVRPSSTTPHTVVATRAAASAVRPDPGGPALPERHRAHADQGGQGRGQGDQVVRVDDPLGQADGEPGTGQGAAPEEEGGSLVVGARGPPGDEQDGGAHEEGAGQQPGHHVAEGRVEQAGEAGRAPHAARLTRTAHVAGLAPRQSAEAVVTEDQVDDAVVLRAPDIGAVGGRRQRHRRHPPPRGHQRGGTQHEDLPHPPPPTRSAPRAGRRCPWRAGSGRPASSW